jgi:hypothetical protein
MTRRVVGAAVGMLAIAVAVVLVLAPASIRAQTGSGAGDELYFQQAAFRIPFNVPPGAQVHVAKLFVSRDQGTNWKWVKDAKPEEREFTYISNDGDGSYWFAVQTITPSGSAIPPTIQGNNGGQVLRVVVDSRPPTVDLTVMHGPDGTARADWKIYDEHLKLESLFLQYRIPPGNQWYPVTIQNKLATGFQTWSAGSQPIEVQMTAQDRAGNIGKDAKTTAPQGSALPTGSGSQPDRRYGVQPDSEIRYVNTSKIRLRYNLADVGKSGVSRVEVWRKPIPGAWDATPMYAEPVNLDQKELKPIVVELGQDDGLYGLTLLAKSGVDVSLPPPAGNDPPQMTVRVIRTQPKVVIDDVLVGKGPNLGRVQIKWQATQKDNLMSKQCITISVSDGVGQWKRIHDGKLDNIGQYVWVVPSDFPPPKVSFKVEAEDWAHNVGTDVRDGVVLDLAAPRTTGIQVEPHTP